MIAGFGDEIETADCYLFEKLVKTFDTQEAELRRLTYAWLYGKRLVCFGL